MKARVKATGEIVDVRIDYKQDADYIAQNGQLYWQRELDFNNLNIKDEEITNTPDYWTRLEHQYAGMAMQGMIKRAYNAYCDDCANYENMIFEDAQALLKDHAEALADVCVEFAHALVEKLKMKEERK